MTVAPENDGGFVIDNKDTSLEVFPLMHPVPSSRRLCFNRRGPFSLEARYTHPEDLPNQNALIGIFKVHGLSCKPGEICKVRVKVRVNAHGIFAVSQAEVAEEYEKEVEIEVPDDTSNVKPDNTASKPMEVETPNNGDVTTTPTQPSAAANEANETAGANKKLATKKTIVKKRAVRYKDLPVDANIMQFSPRQLSEFCEIEVSLAASFYNHV